MADVDTTWIRARDCEASSCPEWQPVPGGVSLRSSDRPDQHITLTADELATLVRAYERGEVVAQ